MTFKKNGSDPITARPSLSMGGLTLVGNAILNALGLSLNNASTVGEVARWNHGRSRGETTHRKRRRNMNLVSRRVRRKHRLARKAA